MAIWTFCAAYAKHPARGYRILLHGNNGTGKSHCAKAVFRWASRVALNLPWLNDPAGMRLAAAAMVNWPQFVDRLKRGEWDRMDELMAADLLVLDDIGAEHDPSRVGEEKLYLLLEKRESRWTMLTTNVGLADWPAKFERRIVSRFFRNFVRVSLENVPDWKVENPEPSK